MLRILCSCADQDSVASKWSPVTRTRMKVSGHMWDMGESGVVLTNTQLFYPKYWRDSSVGRYLPCTQPTNVPYLAPDMDP